MKLKEIERATQLGVALPQILITLLKFSGGGTPSPSLISDTQRTKVEIIKLSSSTHEGRNY